jgi:predicted RNase H-like nuclease
VIVGLDGCKGGWIATAGKGAEDLEILFFSSLLDMEARLKPELVLIDTPIGLSASGRRACDVAVRAALQAGRKSSLFPAPPRGLLFHEEYNEANAWSKTHFGKGISRQSFFILPKMREVEAYRRSTSLSDSQILETFPELAFQLWAGATIAAKKTGEGKQERRALILRDFGFDLTPDYLRTRGIPSRHWVDALDSVACWWSGHRVANGQAAWLPPEPEFDEFGRRMQIGV